MKIAYIVLAHKLPGQLIRLIRTLDSSSATFLIHIDKKAEGSSYKKVSDTFADAENVYFLERRPIYYGDFNHVQSTLDGIHMLLELDISFDYVILLTGQDYPVKSQNDIQIFLDKNRGKSFMEYFLLPDERWGDEDGGLDRINYWHLNFRGNEFAYLKKKRILKLVPDKLWNGFSRVFHFQRKLPQNIKWYGGSAYWNLSRECIEYIAAFVKENEDTVNFFKHAKISGEMFFQTVLLNSHLKESIVDDSLRYIEWSDSRHPAVFGKKDFGRLMESGNLFARKFDSAEDAEILKMIDQEIS